MAFSLTLTDEQHDVVDHAQRFAADVLRPAAAMWDREEAIPWPVLEQAAEAGLYDPDLYARLSADPSGLSIPLMIEELFWGCAGIGLSIVQPVLALAAIAQAGTDQQVDRWAPECFGRPGDLKLASPAVTEPHGGSDGSSDATHARREGDGWVLEGRKAFVANGGIAGVHVVNAIVERELGHHGQAMFVVPGDNPGLKLIRTFEKLGCRASHHAEIGFEGCRIPADHLLGTEDELEESLARGRELMAAEGDGDPGGSATLTAFETTRPFVAAQAVGVARAALEYARDYATEREVFGEPIIEYPGIAFPLADLATEIDSARMLTWRAAWMAANGVDLVQAEGSMSKLVASEVAVRASEAAMQTLAGWGYVDDHPVEKWYRDAKVFGISEGTSEVQRRIIGRAVGAQRGERPIHHRRAEGGPG